MNTKKFLLFCFLFLFITLGFSQEIIQLNVDKSGYLESQESTSSGTSENLTTPSNEVIPTIKGELNVNAQGALTYNVPIEVFKGVNNFQPNLTLAYSSDGGNGQAGYGWNIVGLSSITIGGKVKHIDGEYEGPQFDESDPYYLDGQRLIGFDDENPNTAVTEIYSTIKITKLDEDDAYNFMVQYPDGKIAKYKEVAPRQYSVGLMIDSYGNEILYTYSTNNNTSYLESISYGKTNGNHPFSITFERETKE
ncbi:MAG: SpvB/TcaC N-terminal domain-containing protein, partial [Weeksellaceae bacterium]